MTTEEIYKKAKRAYTKARKSIETILDRELVNAIDDLVVLLVVDMELSLEEVLSGKITSQIRTIINLLFKHYVNNCESCLICWNTLRQIETEYITAAYNFSAACYRKYNEKSKF